MVSPVERIVGGSSNIHDLFGDEKERARFLRRLGRTIKRKPDSWASSAECMDSALRVDTDSDDFPYSIGNLEPLAENSETAMSLLTSALYAMRGNMMLNEEPKNVVASVRAYAQVYRTNSMVVRWEMSTLVPAIRAFEALSRDSTQEDTVRADAFFVLANLSFLQRQVPHGLHLLHVAQQLAPQDAAFHAIEGCILAIQQDEQGSLNAFNRATALGCNDIEHTLFHRAILSPVPMTTACAWLAQFVSQAERDARKLPEACFRLVMLFGLQGPSHLGAAKRFYETGVQADADRLPAFPDEAAQWRRQARALANRYHACGNPFCPVAAKSRCNRCKSISYCCRECQVKHWKYHKDTCEPLENH